HMALLPIRHPQKDFFVLDISDVVPKDDTASMEHPIFSLATKPDMRFLHYADKNGNVLEIEPSGKGLPTIFDKDILIFCISQLMHLKNQGKPIGKRVRFSAREMMVATNRRTDGDAYKLLEKAFSRLRGTNFKTTIRTGGKMEKRIFGLIDEGGFVYHDDDRLRRNYCEIVLSDWLMRAIESADVVTISPDYFRLRRPLERRIYEIARKHCGKSSKWHIGLDKLQAKTGSNAPLKRFRLNLRQIIEEDHTPFYRIELDENDLVTFRPRSAKIELGQDIFIPEWADEKAREIAREKGWDYYALRDKWLNYARAETGKGNPPKNAGATFVSYCKKQKSLR
ncbi:Plasmid replication initiator protein, partial [Epibacterium ulvae]